MGSNRILGIVMVVIGLMLHASLGKGETIQKVNLVIDPWYPWVLAQKGVATGGVGVELIQELYQRMGLAVEIRIYPFKRVILNLEKGEADGSWLISKNAEREQFAIFSDPFFSDYYLVYSSANRDPPFEWNTWEELAPYKIGVTSGFNYGEEFHAAQKKHGYLISETTTDLQIIRMLLYGRVDLILLN